MLAEGTQGHSCFANRTSFNRVSRLWVCMVDEKGQSDPIEGMHRTVEAKLAALHPGNPSAFSFEWGIAVLTI